LFHAENVHKRESDEKDIQQQKEKDAEEKTKSAAKVRR